MSSFQATSIRLPFPSLLSCLHVGSDLGEVKKELPGDLCALLGNDALIPSMEGKRLSLIPAQIFLTRNIYCLH